MDGNSTKGPDVSEMPLESIPKTNKSVPKGLIYRELGFKQKQGTVASEFQRAAEDRLVVKNHEELPCELPDASRSTFLMVFSPDGTKVASTHGNHNVYVTDLNTGKNVNTLSGHPRTPWCITFHPSSNQILASGCLGGQVRVWDLHGGSEVWTTESQTVIASLAFHPTDQILVIATYNEVLFWDWSQPVPFTKCYTSNEKEKVRYVAFDPLGHKLITGISNAPHNQTQWDRVAAPTCQGSGLASTSHSYNPRSPTFPPDRERRMAVCYRSLVEQYEQLVQQYYNLSRSRTTMDRGTDPMDLSELTPARLQSGSSRTQPHAQVGCMHVRGTNRFLMHDNNSSSIGDNSSTNGNENSSSTTGASSGGSCCSARSVYLSRVRNILRRRAQEDPEAFRIFESLSECADGEHRQAAGHGSADQRESATVASSPTRRLELDNVTDTRRAVHLEYGLNVEQTSVQHSSIVEHIQTAVDSARRRRRSMDGERQIVPDITTDHSTLPLEQQGSFARLHSQALPPSAYPPERPCRFFVSQRSAFHPRIPRGDQHPHSQSQLTARPPSAMHTPRSGYILHRRLRDAYHLQNFQDDNETSTLEPLPSQGLDNSSDVGVRYGIQLLSRHIDNMQRLCRARLEILQLQQIRRMWEDLQRQIRSLHVAVRDSTFALTGTHSVPGGRGRRRFRLCSNPREDSGLIVSDDVQLRQNNQRRGESEASATEQGPYIPSVSQMLKSAHISDTGPPADSSQIPTSSSGASASNEQPVSGEQGPSNEDCYRTGTLDPLHTQFEIMAKKKLDVDKRNYTKKEEETAINNVAATSNTIVTTTADIAEPVGTAANKFISSDGQQSVSQSVKLVSFGGHEDSAEGPTQQDLPESRKGIKTSDLPCESDNLNVKNVGNSPYGVCSTTASPYKKQQGDGVDSNETSDPVDILCNTQSDSCISVTGEGVCASNSSSSTPVVPPVNATIDITAATTVTSSSTVDPNTVPSSSTVSNRSSEALGHLLSNSWRRYGSANATINTNVSSDTSASPAATASSSQHQRLWRISRRVYLRRPRLLTLGHRSRTISRQQSSNSVSQKNSSAGSFRRLESGRRPWFVQSVSSRNLHTRMTLQGINTSAQVGTLQTTLSNFAEECGSNGSGASSGVHKQVNSDAAREVPLSDQSSSAGEAQESADKPTLNTSTENDLQPSSSSQQEHVSFHTSSLADEERDTSGTGIGTDMPTGTSRRAGHNTGTGESDSAEQTQHEPTVYGSFRAVAARLQSLIRQRREQQESLRRENSSGRRSQQTDLWELRDRHLWFRGDTNSGSDSDSNPESDRQQVWEWPAAADRLIMAIENETSNSSMFGSRSGRSDALDEDWEWTRESTRLRARQVLGLMVESLTQFFEENGLSRSASHAVLDEQLYHLYILLQLALELTDLLLAQLVSTRRELEHRWMHRLHSPVALDATTPAGQHQLRRCRGTDRPQESHSLWQEYLGHERPYRRLLRCRNPFIEADVMTELGGVSSTVRGVRSSPRRLNCYSRRGSHTGIAATLRMCREMGSRPFVRGPVPRRANIVSHLPPYSRSTGIRSSYTSRETGRNLLTSEETPTTGLSETRSAHVLATDAYTVPIASMPVSVNQQNTEGYQQQQQQQEQQRQQQQQQQDTFTVPLVQVNDVLIPDTSVLNQPQPRQRPQSPPPHPSHLRNPFIQQQQQSQHTQSPLRYLGDSWRYPVSPGDSSWRSGWRSRFLHPRYVGQSPFSEDQDEPLIGPTLENINIIRDAPLSANHRIQVWDFTNFRIPDISDAEKNVVVAECKIQNDASVDISNDGRLLVTLLPTGRLRSTDMLGIYSLEWESLGQCLYTTSFEQSAVSVSLSPAGHHLLVGFASRRVALLPTDRHTMAQIFRLEGGLPGRNIGARGRLCHIRDIEQDREQGYMSLNCIRWAPSPGQGLVYGTNTGKLKVLQ